MHEEGVTQGRWALLDYFDFVVHVFHPSLRQFYQLERLWSDAETVALTTDDARQNGTQGSGAPAGTGAADAGAASGGRQRGTHTTEEALQ
jgi:hypothetical protein